MPVKDREIQGHLQYLVILRSAGIETCKNKLKKKYELFFFSIRPNEPLRNKTQILKHFSFLVRYVLFYNAAKLKHYPW